MHPLSPDDMAAIHAAVSNSPFLPEWLRTSRPGSPVLRALVNAIPRTVLAKNLLGLSDAEFEAGCNALDADRARIIHVSRCLSSGLEGDDYFRQPDPRAGRYAGRYCWHLALNTNLYGRVGDRYRLAANLNLQQMLENQ